MNSESSEGQEQSGEGQEHSSGGQEQSGEGQEQKITGNHCWVRVSLVRMILYEIL